MVKTIKNIDWIKLVLEKHQPRSYTIGDQRDPVTVIECMCQHGINPRDKRFSKYTDHVLDLINKEFPNALSEPEPYGMEYR